MNDGPKTSPDEFLKVVGTILTLWGEVEQAHAIIFRGIASGVNSSTALSRAYWSVHSFEGKHRMVDAALRDALSQHAEYLATWNNINERLKRKNTKRNKIAHGSVISLLGNDHEVRDHRFYPYFHSRMMDHVGDKGFKPGMLIGELKQFAESLRELEKEMREFWSLYYREQILPRSTTLPDGSTEIPRFHRPKFQNPEEPTLPDQPPEA